jgi:hypothetical protein
MQDSNMWMMLIGQLGFPIALVIYLLKRDKERDKETSDRERRLGDRIDKLEDEHRQELVKMTNASTEAITKSTTQSSRMCRSIESLVEVMRARSCLLQTQPIPVPTARPIRQVDVDEHYQPTPSAMDIPAPDSPTGDTTKHNIPAQYDR